ncbi:class I SAM-dependent methyltransferase [Legionella sp. km772]|uniref:class I SAM-dependent methyltransferase n=1 Tax=Legionella sp. km772 TaxID=2498111 RepID=UPI000F8CB93A|nr:class I SAM-dependent methyltransferase [Legionella sp. km772]RUR08739.1 methyltransferase domain-containing protein [Legionella sp. km772]
MKMNVNYFCTYCTKQKLVVRNDGLECPQGHFFPYLEGTDVPVFACEPENANEYSTADAVAMHDNAFDWVYKTFGADEKTLRKNLISRLNLTKSKKILVTGAGNGNDLPFIIERLEGCGTIYAQDFAKQMLVDGVNKYQAHNSQNLELFFSLSDATNLPFSDDFFDIAYHFGGINLFSDIGKGISEMNRVVKSGGQVLICDEGIAPWLKNTEIGNMLIKNNPLYAYEAPLALIPPNAREVKLSWELYHCFYVIEFIVSKEALPINIDVPHKGKRGGTIRSRYYGQLEGIDPLLKDKVYAAAEKQGLSRVEYLERVLNAACNAVD